MGEVNMATLAPDEIARYATEGWVKPAWRLSAGRVDLMRNALDELIAWAKQRCANFRVPRYLRIVDNFEAIGMTASGKVQKTRLREHAIAEFKLQA